jgi:transposase
VVESQRTYGVTRIGPVADDPSGQARAGTGFDTSRFGVDWARQLVTCPMGKQSIAWLPNTYKHGMTWEVRLARKDGTPCLHRAQWTRAKQEPRLLGVNRTKVRKVSQLFKCHV